MESHGSQRIFRRKGASPDIAKRYGINDRTVRRWAQRYQKQGISAFERGSGNTSYTAEFKMNGVEIEIIGCFIWLSGNTKEHREEIKSLEYQGGTVRKKCGTKPLRAIEDGEAEKNTVCQKSGECMGLLESSLEEATKNGYSLGNNPPAWNKRF